MVRIWGVLAILIGLTNCHLKQEYVIKKIEVPDSVWTVVKKWPGLVGDREERLKNVPVEIDGVFNGIVCCAL